MSAKPPLLELGKVYDTAPFINNGGNNHSKNPPLQLGPTTSQNFPSKNQLGPAYATDLRKPQPLYEAPVALKLGQAFSVPLS